MRPVFCFCFCFLSSSHLLLDGNARYLSTSFICIPAHNCQKQGAESTGRGADVHFDPSRSKVSNALDRICRPRSERGGSYAQQSKWRTFSVLAPCPMHVPPPSQNTSLGDFFFTATHHTGVMQASFRSIALSRPRCGPEPIKNEYHV